MESQQTTGRFDAIITILSRPRLMLQGTIEYLLAWSFTRSWGRLLLVHTPWILLLAAFTGIVVYGSLLSRSTLAQRYGDWVAEELPEALRSTDKDAAPPEAGAGGAATAESKMDSDTEADSTNQSAGGSSLDEQIGGNADLVSRYGDLLLRRLMQLQDSNSRTTYLVALQLAHQNRWAQARQMMRRLAPAGGGGFVPAHHWLAADRLQHQQLKTLEQSDLDVLIKDLSMATRWSGCHPALRHWFSQFLESQGNAAEAIAVIDQGGELSLEDNLAIARLAAQYDRQGRFERAAKEIKQEVQDRVDAETVTSQDWTILANLFLFENNPEKARFAAMKGLTADSENLALRRLVSESYRIEYLQSIQQEEGKTKINLGLLDAALKADPTNPNVGSEIARLLAAGEDPTPEFKSALEQQLAAGQATALTHILLANRHLQSGDLQAAAPHLELALRQAPNNPITMNNLALALSRTGQQPERAEQLATDAVRREPKRAEFRDTLGEVRARNGDQLGAIESYEAAIGLDPNASATRKKLADLYRELGMSEMADVQQRQLEE